MRGRWALASGVRREGGGRRSRERAERGLGPRGEERGGELGRPGEREREVEADRAGLGSGPRGGPGGLTVLGLVLGYLSYFFSLFYFYSKQSFEFKTKFEFKPHSIN